MEHNDVLTEDNLAHLPNYHAKWIDQIRKALWAANAQGIELKLSRSDYQLARIIGKGVRLVLYPHRSTSGNYHVRIRNENSSNKALAWAIVEASELNISLKCRIALT